MNTETQTKEHELDTGTWTQQTWRHDRLGGERDKTQEDEYGREQTDRTANVFTETEHDRGKEGKHGDTDDRTPRRERERLDPKGN